MKKAISLVSILIICLSLFACAKKEGDLGKQTSIDKTNGYTLVQEVIPFKFSKEEDTLKDEDTVTTAAGATFTKIQTKSDALEIAKKSVKSDYNKINIYFDRTQGIWKIVFSVDTAAADNTFTNKIVESIYVDEDGYVFADVKA